MMSLLVLSFFAGMLTILAPCVLPILPVIIGGSVVSGKKSRPWVIILSFAISVLLFTLLIKLLVEQFGVFPDDLKQVAAWLLIVFGLFLLFPQVWQWLMHMTGIESATSKAQAETGSGLTGDIFLGFILGPVFNSCSPTYAILVATILPVNFWRGVTNIVAYILGFSLLLGLVAWGGTKIVNRLKRAADPKGWFKRIIALLLIFVGVAMLFGWERDVETWILEQDIAGDIIQRESKTVKETIAK